jgi:predicted RNA-binding protein associated with RNAse of E/G family
MKVQKKNLAGEVVFQYEGEVLQRGDKAVTLQAFFGNADRAVANVLLKKGDRFVETFYSDRWYNIFEIYDREDGKLKGWYCNIGKPAIIEQNVVSYVDLALDLWVAPDGTQTILDEDELAELKLDDELKQMAFDGLRELQTRFKTNTPPI